MNLTGKNSDTITPVKEPKSNRSKLAKKSENLNPNLTSPDAKPTANKCVKKSLKSVRNSPNFVNDKIRERRFVVAKKNSKKSNSSNVSCKCLINGKLKKCACVAYEKLRASREGFFRNLNNVGDCDRDEIQRREDEEEEAINSINRNSNLDENEVTSEIGSAIFKRRRDKLLEEVRRSVPELGRVNHLVNAFEKLLLNRKSKDLDENDKEEGEDTKKGNNLQSVKVPEMPSDLLLTSDNLGLERLGGRNSRRRQQQHKVTSQKPFVLRTEKRGRCKEEEFTKKVHEKMTEEEKQRIPIAQGLPWTTDEPERLAKPPIKESTKLVDLVLHSDVRAVGRADFDHQVAEKMSLIEQYRMEMERQQKLEEEEEIRRLRKELVPRAQPMPYFDRPFIPRRSEKQPAISKSISKRLLAI